jgi:glycosyltransferase involved in cell wall biosynthesis
MIDLNMDDKEALLGPPPYRQPVTVVVPAYNEEGAIGAQVEKIKKVLTGHGVMHEVLVVDDSSQDKTAEAALLAGGRVIRHQENRGYGAALKSGIVEAKYETIVIIDGDSTYPAEEIPTLLGKLESVDMVVGARIGKQVHIPLVRRPAKWVLGWLAARVAGRSIPDINSGLRAFRRECVKQYFSILPNQFSFTTTVTMALFGDDYQIVYHPINYYTRVGKSKIRPRAFMDFTILVLRMAMLFQPLRVFVPLALTFIFFGTLKSFFDLSVLFQEHSALGLVIFYQPILSTSAILLLLAGMQLLLIGMVADGLLRKISHHSGPLIPSQAKTTSEFLSEKENETPRAPFNS